jgi:3-oxoacyl-[acyl-carrier-protein] synthase III
LPIKVGIAGTGSHMPEAVITNDELAALINKGGKGADWALAKLGIKERRFLTRLDPKTGHPVASADELEMAERAARAALTNARLQPKDIDGIWYVSCTQLGPERQHFSKSAFELHRRLGLRATAVPLEMDAGCGGAVHAIISGSKMLAGNGMENMLVVASNAPSRYYRDWAGYVSNEVWLSMYIFGDGAGAAVLSRSESIPSGSEILASYLAVDPAQPLMYYEPRGNCPEPLYVIDGRSVAASFGIYAKRALEGLQAQTSIDLRSEVKRYYFHQVNGQVLMKFVEKTGLPKDRVAVHVDHYGNIAAAATLVLVDEDRRCGRVAEEDMCVFCTVGAGAQFGAMLVCKVCWAV